MATDPYDKLIFKWNGDWKKHPEIYKLFLGAVNSRLLVFEEFYEGIPEIIINFADGHGYSYHLFGSTIPWLDARIKLMAIQRNLQTIDQALLINLVTQKNW